MKPEDFCFSHITQTFSDVNAFRTAYTVSCLACIPFLLTSIVGNFIMVFCLWKCRSLHPPFKALLRSLVLSDLGVGLVVQPLFLVSHFTALTENMRYFCVIQVVYNTVGYFIAGVSFVTTTSIALDRFFAIQMRIRYRQFATLRKTHALLVFIWVLCAFLSSVWIWNLALHRIFRDTLDFMYHYRMRLLHPGIHVGTAMPSRAQCQSSSRKRDIPFRTLQEHSHKHNLRVWFSPLVLYAFPVFVCGCSKIWTKHSAISLGSYCFGARLRQFLV